MKNLSLAQRFINSYNQIDYSLRIRHNFKRSMGFSDMIRKSVPINNITRKYEDDLIDFGRLRNAIIHGSNDDILIAEPHEDVVLKIEHIERLITTPPKAIDVLTEKEVFTVNFDMTIKDVIRTIAKTSYSNLPVYKNGELIGVANGQKILNSIGEYLITNNNVEDFISSQTIESIVVKKDNFDYYMVMPSNSTVDEVLDRFLSNRKLLAIILTKTGTMHEPPLAIITSSDYMALNKIMEDY